MLEYVGYKGIILSERELANLYENASENTYECLINEYLIVKDSNGDVIDSFRWDGFKYVRVVQKQINNEFVGKIKARNPEQAVAIDMLYDTNSTIKVLTGGFGTGKTMLMVAVALDLIKKNKFDKMVFIRNNWETKGSKPIGSIPGDPNAKMLPFAMCLSDQLGGTLGLEYLIRDQKLEILHLGYARGRDLKRAIVFCTESENLLTENMQLLIGRIGEGSILLLDGDIKQCDDKIFETNSGLTRVIERLQGNPLFGYVKLKKTERSITASLADLLD